MASLYNDCTTMMEKSSDERSSLYERIGRLRWKAALLALGLVFLHQWIEHAYLFFLPKWTHFWTQVVFYGLVGPALAWLALTSLRNQVGETEEAERAARRSRDELAEVNRRLEFLIDVERRLAEALEEEDLLDAIMQLPFEVVPALGVSLIRFDHDGGPLPSHHHGKLSPEEFQQWAAHLAPNSTHQPCETCAAQHASREVPCPVLTATPPELQAERVHCLTLTRGDRRFGMLNIYLGDDGHPTAEERELLQVMASSMSLALESQLLRAREMGTLYHLQEIHHLEGLESQLQEVANSTIRALELDGGAAFLVQEETLVPSVVVDHGSPPSEEFLTGMASSVKQSESPLLAGDLDVASPADESIRALIVAPLRKEGKWLGSLLFWSSERTAFGRRQVRIVESVASQAALLVENHRLYRQAEYRAGLAERARLAREIHDGLAQTLGYLKLRTSQLMTWLQQDQQARVQKGITEIRRLLDEAYVDAREAIDGLRMDPTEDNFDGWLQEVYSEFTELSQVPVTASEPPAFELPPEMRLQLLRILQEALGNVRKHANATKVWVDWENDDHWVVLRVRDNGRGFDPEQITEISRHGLRIMRERAELLGADFQLASRPGEGTQVVVRLPLTALTRQQPHD